MKRFAAIAAVTLILFAPSQVFAQATPVASPVASPVAADSLTYGPGSRFLNSGESGVVSVIAVGELAANRAPIIVRNNTDNVAFNVAVTAEIRDGDGALVGSLETFGIQPFSIQPGGIGIGTLSNGMSLEDVTGAIGELRVSQSSTDNVGWSMAVVEVNVTDSQVLVVVRNDDTRTASSVFAAIGCFDADGKLAYAEMQSAGNPLEAGADALLTFGAYGQISARCDEYVLVASNITNF